MSHQDSVGHSESAPEHQALKQALDWLLSGASLAKVGLRGDCTWSPTALIFAAILWAWSDQKTLTGRFAIARKIVVAMGILPRLPATSYQAFLKILRTWTVALTVVLKEAFRRRMQEDLAPRFTVEGFIVFGVDGSRLALPRTGSNESRFAPRPKGKGKGKNRRRGGGSSKSKAARARRSHQKKVNVPQMWQTTMFHVGTGLPWDWRHGPSDSSERDHLLEMIAGLPAGALITADAGFVGYQCWVAIRKSHRHLLIRVGANVRLLRNLGYVKEGPGIIYLWPDREASRNQPPLVLRLVVAKGPRHPVYLVTSVLDEAVLWDQQVVRIYSLRWGVELFYRHLKQTFERSKLRSHKGENAELEATWSLLGLWAIALHAQQQLAKEGIPAHRISIAGVLRAYRQSMRQYKSRPDAGESLCELVSQAVIDDYARANKSSRGYPRKKQGHAIGAPEIRDATADEIQLAATLREADEIQLAATLRDQLSLGLTA
jgi:Transposase DDE domain